MPEQQVHICNNLNRDQQIRAKAIEISATVFSRIAAADIMANNPIRGNPFLLARKIESYIRNDIISSPTGSDALAVDHGVWVRAKTF